MYEPRDARKAELYSIDLRASNGNGGKPLVQLKAHNAIIANGLAWSPDVKTLYWGRHAEPRDHAWDWDAQGNVMSRHRVFQQLPANPMTGSGPARLGGRPDGAAVDIEGNTGARCSKAADC